MSPWEEKRRSAWPIYLGIAVIVLGMVGGYLLMTGIVGNDDGPDGHDAKTPGPVAPSTTPDQHERPALSVVSWGQASGQLAVVVRNQTDRTIERMRVRITARDRSGATVVSTTGTAPDVCCTIVGLPPGKTFGLFAELASDTAWNIARVDVEPVAAQLGAAGKVTEVKARATRMERYHDDTVVTADLTADGRPLTGYIAAQAFLAGSDGRIAQVISGRFYCFGPGSSRQVRLHLFHAVPTELQLQRVVAYSLPAGVRPFVPWECS